MLLIELHRYFCNGNQMTAFEELTQSFISLVKTDTEIIETLQKSLNFYKQRCELLQQVQKYMRDPERTIVCDILANNALLPDPEGKRYGLDLKKKLEETK